MNYFYIQAILTASLGGVLYGYDMGVISGALPLLSSYFQLTTSQEEWIVSLLYFGGGVGAASGGFLCDWFGRKFAIMFTDVMFGIGAFLLYSAQSVESVLVGRFVVGWAVAVSGIADVVYLHEISSVWDGVDIVCEKNRTENHITGVPHEDSAVVESEDGEIENKHNVRSVGGRGSVVSVNEACISLGFLLAFGVAYGLGDQQSQNTGEQPSDAWRMMFGFGGMLAALQFIGMLCMPESPVWLHEKGRSNEAMSARNKIRGTVGASENRETGMRHRGISGGTSIELPSLHMRSTSVNQMQSRGSSSSLTSSRSETLDQPAPSFAADQPQSMLRNERCLEWLVYLVTKITTSPSRIKTNFRRMKENLAPYKKQSIIAFFLAVSQQFCGHPSVLSYAHEMFAMLNQPSHSGQTSNAANDSSNGSNIDVIAIELTVGIGVLKFLTTCIVIMYVEKGGRRSWLLSGMTCILISLTFLIVAFIDHGDKGIGYDTDNMEQLHSSSFRNNLGIVGIYGIAVGYAAGYGPLTWLITSELFPSSIRGRALGFATVATYMAAGLVSNTFLSLQTDIGISACFALYWIATIISIVFVWLGVPDTGSEKTPEEIERVLNEMWIWKCSSHNSRRPIFVCANFTSGETVSFSRTFWRYVSYDSQKDSHDNNLRASPDASMGGENAGISPLPIPSSPAPHSGLIPRRSCSANRTKEIV